MTTKFTDSQFKNFIKCDCAAAWAVIKHDVITQLLAGIPAVPVASLSEARQTELLSVIVKEHKSLTQRQNIYWLVGRLRDLLVRVGTPGNWEQVTCDSSTVNDRKFNQNFKYEISDIRNGVSKSISLTLNGCHRIVIKKSNTDNLHLDLALPGLVNAHKVYLVTTLFVVTSLSISAKINQSDAQLTLRGATPIAFDCDKYQVTATGKLLLTPAFQRDKMVTGRFIEKTTLRHPRDPLPPPPPPPASSPPSHHPCPTLLPVKRNPTDKLPSPPVPDQSLKQGAMSAPPPRTTGNMASSRSTQGRSTASVPPAKQQGQGHGQGQSQGQRSGDDDRYVKPVPVGRTSPNAVSMATARSRPTSPALRKN